jgi:hypothetical protein
MDLPHPGRFDDVPIVRRSAGAWPDGKRLAVYVALNLESYAFGEGLSEDIVPGSGTPDVLNWSWREYGNRVGAWRLLDVFKQSGIAPSLLVNSAIYARHAELAQAFRAAGAAIVAHGRTNSESQAGLDEAEPSQLAHDQCGAGCAVDVEVTHDEHALARPQVHEAQQIGIDGDRPDIGEVCLRDGGIVEFGTQEPAHTRVVALNPWARPDVLPLALDQAVALDAPFSLVETSFRCRRRRAQVGRGASRFTSMVPMASVEKPAEAQNTSSGRPKSMIQP